MMKASPRCNVLPTADRVELMFTKVNNGWVKVISSLIKRSSSSCQQLQSGSSHRLTSNPFVRRDTYILEGVQLIRKAESVLSSLHLYQGMVNRSEVLESESQQLEVEFRLHYYTLAKEGCLTPTPWSRAFSVVGTFCHLYDFQGR